MVNKRISKRLMILIGSAIVVLLAIVVLIVRTSKTPTISADSFNNGAASDQLKIRGSLPALE